MNVSSSMLLWNIPRRLAVSLLVAGMVALSPLAGGHEAGAQQQSRVGTTSYTQRLDTTFAFDKSGSVTVTVRLGDVIVTGWARNEVRIRSSGDGASVRLDASSNRVLLDATGGRRGNDTRYELSVPYGVRVVARSQTGDLEIRGTRGQVEAHVTSGDIRLEDITTRLDATTMSGDIEIAGVTGDIAISSVSGSVALRDARGGIDIGTVSGDIELRSITSKLVRAKTTSGDVNFDGTIDATGRYELVTHSGDIDLMIPRDANAQLTVSTWNGSIDSQFPITLQPGQHDIGITKSKRYTFDIGGGAARIFAETFSGDIAIEGKQGGGRRE